MKTYFFILFFCASTISLGLQPEASNQPRLTRLDLQNQIAQTRDQLQKLSDQIKLMSNKIKSSRRARPVPIQKLRRKQSDIQIKLNKLESELKNSELK